MQLTLINDSGQSSGKVEAADVVFNRDFNEPLVHQVVVAYQANARSANRAQKDRSEVNKSTRKPWRQKGTGRARVGRASSPLWRGGGKVFPNSPEENYSHKLNKKMYRAGVRSILSQLAREDRLVVVESFSVEAPKTKLVADKLKQMGMDSVLLITEAFDETLYLASRNLQSIAVIEPEAADPLSLIYFDKVVVTRAALGRFEEMLS
ncbi:MAG: 50S ribosomal protein L4 [Proteobacteria bacterium]|jgi:large subunit ribosomal protein L4|nr:50S ribosomal protein L4 [Pseudomonadota bacterium]MDP4618154.1 50S ribosomal protein L4 [Burkholderiaceae bacterium]MDA0876354.1 50S ribosomal protein L4 [Pseudomonadota bacterium]MDA1186544.1 50S ribosomal protein L4 [Pseudomonadota bacterium]MDP4677832.1 50S ribosomal protein L4 [Burkholderiaceae bacterium]